jgi:hypothetical protein
MEILRELPQYVSSIVVEYMMPNELGSCEKITFHKLRRDAGSDLDETNYSPKYELAYDEHKNKLCRTLYISYVSKDTQVLHLSRISKKNGRHRYYLTFVDEHVECIECGNPQCSKRYCDGRMIQEVHFSSTYIGTNLEEAIVSFLLHKTRN